MGEKEKRTAPGAALANRLILLLTAVYTASYLCRYSYATVLPEIVNSSGRTKTELSVAVTCLFVCYGAGQIVSGFLGDRSSPKKLILFGMLASSAFNFIMPFTGALWAERAIWALNGFAQAFFWPPIVVLMSSLLTPAEYARGTVSVSYGGYFGTILLYLLSPLFINVWSWKGIFLFSGTVGIVIALVFVIAFPDVSPEKRVRAEKEERKAPALSIFSPGLVLIMLCIVAQGFIRDGITTWMPTYVSELFDLGSGASILTGILLPVFAIVCLKLTSILNRKKLTNPLVCAAVLFGAGAAASLVLFAVNGKAAVATVILSALLTGSMHGVNLMLICMIPPYFKNSGNVSTVSGLLNATAYAGSSFSAYGIALLSDNIGWRFLFLVLAVTSAVSGLISFSVRKFRSSAV